MFCFFFVRLGTVVVVNDRHGFESCRVVLSLEEDVTAVFVGIADSDAKFTTASFSLIFKTHFLSLRNSTNWAHSETPGGNPRVPVFP